MFPRYMLMGLFLRQPSWILTGNANAQHKNACILKTVRDRAILTKFLTHGYLCRVVNPIF